jgi:hypothetical protein
VVISLRVQVATSRSRLWKLSGDFAGALAQCRRGRLSGGDVADLRGVGFRRGRARQPSSTSKATPSSVDPGYQTTGLLSVGRVYGESLGQDDFFVVHPAQLEGDLQGEN